MNIADGGWTGGGESKREEVSGACGRVGGGSSADVWGTVHTQFRFWEDDSTETRMSVTRLTERSGRALEVPGKSSAKRLLPVGYVP